MAKKIEIIGGGNGVPSIKDVTPSGNYVLFERLNTQELTNTKIYLGEGSDNSGLPQGYVLALGPLVSEKCGFKVGDRVVISGQYTPIPKYDDNPRERGVLLPDMIKAVLVEA